MPVPGREGMGGVVELDAHRVAPAGRERRGLGMAVTVGEVEHAVGDERRGAVGRDVAEARDDEGLGPVGAELERRDRRAQDLEALGERRAVEAQGRAVVEALVRRQIACAVAAPLAVGEAQPLRRADRERGLGGRLLLEPARAQRQPLHLDARRGPAGLGDPAAGPLVVGHLRRGALLQPDAVRGLGHDAAVDALEPVVPPAQRLLQEADLRAGPREMRIAVRPGPDQALSRA